MPWWMAFTLGLQHVLGMFVGIITPPLLVALALNLPPHDRAFLISMSLFTSGVTTLVQVHRLGPVGSGLLSVQGPSFAFVPLAIETGKAGGLPLVFGLALSGAWLPMLVSWTLPWVRRLFPPVVTGTAISLIGFSLIRVGFQQLAGGLGAPDYGSARHFALGLITIATIIAAQGWGRGGMRSVTIALGLLVGYVVAALFGQLHFDVVGEAAMLHVPQPLRYGLAFDWKFLAPWLVAYMLVALETIGDLTATSAVSREPVEGELFQSRLRGGLFADGLGCVFTAFWNAMPKTTFAQNNGIIALTGVASRRAGVATGLILIGVGLFPKIAALISIIPAPVLGGATLLMFATVAIAGMQLVAHDGFTPRNSFILAVSLGLGLGVTMTPEPLQGLEAALTSQNLSPALARSLHIFLESGMAVGSACAMLLNLVLPANLNCHSPESETGVPSLPA